MDIAENKDQPGEALPEAQKKEQPTAEGQRLYDELRILPFKAHLGGDKFVNAYRNFANTLSSNSTVADIQNIAFLQAYYSTGWLPQIVEHPWVVAFSLGSTAIMALNAEKHWDKKIKDKMSGLTHEVRDHTIHNFEKISDVIEKTTGETQDASLTKQILIRINYMIKKLTGSIKETSITEQKTLSKIAEENTAPVGKDTDQQRRNLADTVFSKPETKNLSPEDILHMANILTGDKEYPNINNLASSMEKVSEKFHKDPSLSDPDKRALSDIIQQKDSPGKPKSPISDEDPVLAEYYKALSKANIPTEEEINQLPQEERADKIKDRTRRIKDILHITKLSREGSGETGNDDQVVRQTRESLKESGMTTEMADDLIRIYQEHYGLNNLEMLSYITKTTQGDKAAEESLRKKVKSGIGKIIAKEFYREFGQPMDLDKKPSEEQEIIPHSPPDSQKEWTSKISSTPLGNIYKEQQSRA